MDFTGAETFPATKISDRAAPGPDVAPPPPSEESTPALMRFLGHLSYNEEEEKRKRDRKNGRQPLASFAESVVIESEGLQRRVRGVNALRV